MHESFYPPSAIIVADDDLWIATRPVFYEFEKNPEIEAGRLVVDGIAQSGVSRRSASWIMQDARRARNVERDRNERKGCRIGKKKGAATGSSQRVSVKERFKASLIPDDHSSRREWRNRKRSAEAPSSPRARACKDTPYFFRRDGSIGLYPFTTDYRQDFYGRRNTYFKE